MSPAFDDAAFERFATQCRKDLQRIARHTRGELEVGDVINEAWALAREFVRAEDASLLDLDSASDRQLLLRHLYQHLVRYTEQTVRHAVRLDHAPGGDAACDDAHPLAALLVSHDGLDPLGELLERETQIHREATLAAHGSQACAYVHLLCHFNQCMTAVAEHLRVSVSYAYQRCAAARRLAVQADHIQIPMVDGFLPGPWRGFKLPPRPRAPFQLTLEFGQALPF